MQSPQAPPNSPYPGGGPPPPEQSPYDFFLNNDQGSKKPAAPKGGSGFFKILIFAVVFFVILGIAAVVMSSNRSSTPETVGFAPIVGDQIEIIRVGTLGVGQVNSASLKDFSTTTVATTTSAKNELVTHITKRGTGIDEKALAVTSKNPRVDEILTAAASASTYDATFTTTMQSLLTEYQTKLQRTLALATIEADRTILNKNLEAVKLLLQMLSQ